LPEIFYLRHDALSSSVGPFALASRNALPEMNLAWGFRLGDWLPQNDAMMWRVVVVALLCISILVSTPSAHIQKSLSRAADPDYSSALATVNRFLAAWQNQDHETGMMMLSDAAREHTSRERLEEFFSSRPPAAFEIYHGKRLNTGEYAFPVVLFGFSDPPSHRHLSRILTTKLAPNDWAIDRLPK
jgi:hypothetical protein